MQETVKRSLVKALVWRLICVITSVLVIFALVGRWDLAAAVGGAYNLLTTILYYVHERVWNRVKWGRVKKVEL